MSQENVDVVRAAVEAYQQPEVLALLASGDLDLELFDPQIEWDASRLEDLIPDLAEVYWGHEACEPIGDDGSTRGRTLSSRFRTCATRVTRYWC